MAHQIVGGDVDIVEQEEQASHKADAKERGCEVAGSDVFLVENHPCGVAHVEYVGCPIDGHDKRQDTS